MTIKLFAGLAERIERREVSVDVQGPLTVDAIKTAFLNTYPETKDLVPHCLVSVNREYADGNREVSSTDEIALIPPVGGGSPELTDHFQSCRVVDEPLSVEAAFQQLESVYCGGTVIFVGTIREWTKGRKTTSLTYEAYVDMALAQMKRIEDEVKEQWPDVLTLQWHRIGALEPTDVAVICAAASPHRPAAFEAARVLIERLKKEVPIWKKEFYDDGDHVWQAND